MNALHSSDISKYLLHNFHGITQIEAWGEKSFFYNPDREFSRGTYFCTLKEKDGENDSASKLNRDGIYRLNFGIEKSTFLELFHTIPNRPSKGMCIEGDYDFSKLDSLSPHPIYGWMCWVAILNPSNESFRKIESLLSESYHLVIKKHGKKKPKTLSKQ